MLKYFQKVERINTGIKPVIQVLDNCIAELESANNAMAPMDTSDSNIILKRTLTSVSQSDSDTVTVATTATNTSTTTAKSETHHAVFDPKWQRGKGWLHYAERKGRHMCLRHLLSDLL